MWETVRIISECLPKYILWEQVPAVLQQKHIHNFRKYNLRLSELGYNTMYKVQNAKDFGLPQNRERVFVVSIRKDVDNQTFIFPKGFQLDKGLKDVLETEVDAKYYLSEKQVENFIYFNNTHTSDIDNTITTNKGEGQKIKIAGSLGGKYRKANEVLDSSGISTCLDTMQGGNREPKILQIREGTKKGYTEAYSGDGVVLNFVGKARGAVQHQSSPTIQTGGNAGVICFNWQQSESFKNKPMIDMTATLSTQNNQAIIDGLTIRKLTPLECWRLQGFADNSFYKAQEAGISNAQLYKQAGNSIAVNVLQNIFRNLFKNENIIQIRDLVLEQQTIWE